MSAEARERREWHVAEREGFIVPCPLVSRGRPLFTSSGPIPQAMDTRRADLAWSADVDGAGDAPWVAVQAGVGPARLLVSWAAADPRASGAEASMPAAYRIESSADSSNGRDGTWRLEHTVTQNSARARAHVIEFDGQSWVRLTIESAGEGPTRVALRQLDLHDASDGTDDCWLLLGDALAGSERTRAANTPSWVELLHDAYPGYYPALIDESRAGESPSRTLERLEQLLALHPQVRHMALSYGASLTPEGDKEAGPCLESLTRALLASGRVPVFARTPASSLASRERVEAFNRAIEEVEARHELAPGPDLAAWFEAHPEQLDSDGHPTPEGQKAIERLWAEALDVFYVPQ